MLELVRKQESFNDVRVIASEKDSISGATVYKVIGVDGKVDISKTVDVAHFVSKYGNYDSMILNYDTLSGTLDAQIILYSGTTNSGNVSTVFNESTISQMLVELTL